MTPLLEFLRASAPSALEKFVWPMLWQSSLLIGVLFLLDSLLRRRLRPAIRYTLWLVLLVKLLMPPSLALPTSLAWWLRPSAAPAFPTSSTSVVVTYGPLTATGLTASPGAAILPPPPLAFPVSAWAVLVSTGVSVALLCVMLVRWWQVSRMASEALSAPASLERLLGEASSRAEVGRRVRWKLTEHAMSPALCGFFCPVILLPRSLAKTLPANQLQAVLLHELIHLRRKDVWVNALQAVFQVAYWWHPLLWFANARIRRLREEAVDDAVMLALRDEAETYAPTLLEVAKLSLARPLSSLGLVGIFESKTALRERILRLEAFRPMRKAGLTLVSGLGVVAFALTALPMGNGPAQPAASPSSPPPHETSWPDSRFSGYSNLQLQARFFIADEPGLRAVVPVMGNYFAVLNSNELAALEAQFQQAGASEVPITGQVQFQSFSGGHFTWIIGDQVNNEVRYQTRTVGSGTIVIGAEARFIATQSGWVPLELQVVPWVGDQSIRCQVALEPAFSSLPPRWSEVLLPAEGALFWVRTDGMAPGRCQIVVLHNSQIQPGEPPNLPVVTARLSARENAIALSSSARADGLVQEGKLLFELGKLNEAETKLRRAIEEDPKNQAAHYYLNLIQEALYKQNARSEDSAVRPTHPLLLRTNSPSAPSRRQALYAKLTAMRFERISFDHLTLAEVVTNLNEQVRHLDPDKRGITFSINSNAQPAPTNGAVDPSTGLRVPASASDDPDNVGQIPINILPALTDVRVADVLDAVVAVAARRIKYSIEDYGVVFSQKRANEPPPLYTRVIKVDPKTFLNGGASSLGTASTAREANDMLESIRTFFSGLGVSLQPPKSVFFNDGEAKLVVRATLQDLDIIERAVSSLNAEAPHILITAKFVVVPRMSTPSIWLALGLPNPGLEMLNRVLTPEQTQAFLKCVPWDDNNDLLSDARVETLPGRQTQMQVAEDKTIVTHIDPKALTPPGVPGTEIPYVTTNLTFGPTLDIVPYLSADGTDIELTTVATLCEFLGYDKPDKEVTLYVGGKVASGVMPLPHFRIRTITTPDRFRVPKGCSLLLANPIDKNGRAAEADESISKSLFVLITPTLVNPTGDPAEK